MRRARKWWRDPDRSSVVTIGVVLLAVPTTFAVFTEIDRWSLWVRSPIGLGWLVVAVAAVVRQHGHDRDVDALIEERQRDRADEEVLAGRELLTAYLRPGLNGTPESFQWSVHVFDDERNLLLPVFPEPAAGGDPRVFRPGDGAIGTAFAHRRVVVVSGDAVSDASYRLSPEQQEYFRPYLRVVAAPLESGGDWIGTLSAISTEEDGYFDAAQGPAVMRDAANVVATLLVTMVGTGELGR